MTMPVSPLGPLPPMRPVRSRPAPRDREVGRGAAIGAVVATVVTVALGVAWPGGADVLLRVLVAGLVIGFAVLHATRASFRLARPVSTSPFDRSAVPDDVAPVPRDLQVLTRELEWSYESRTEPMISMSIRSRVRREAAARLAEHHGLSLADPAHHGRVQALVSRPMWALIGPPPRPTHPRQPVVLGVLVPARELDRVLDELEQL